jgi:hypothetical protein
MAIILFLIICYLLLVDGCGGCLALMFFLSVVGLLSILNLV